MMRRSAYSDRYAYRTYRSPLSAAGAIAIVILQVLLRICPSTSRAWPCSADSGHHDLRLIDGRLPKGWLPPPR